MIVEYAIVAVFTAIEVGFNIYNKEREYNENNILRKRSYINFLK